MKKANKKILFVSPKQSSFFIPMTAALQQMGFEVIHFDYLKPNLIARILGYITNILPKKGAFHPLLIFFINQCLRASVAQHKPYYLLVIKGEILRPDTLAAINKQGIITINWFPDNDGLWNLLIKTAPFYTYYFSVCHYLTKKLTKYGRKTYYLPVAGQADIEIIEKEKKYNLVFVGHRTNRRIEFFSKICDLGFDLWGYPHWKSTTLHPFYHNQLSQEQLKNIFRQAKIVINVSTGEREVKLDIANLRNFEATGVGAFVLCEYNQATAELFKNNHEIVFFKGTQDLQKKAKYFLSHEQERNNIRLRGWKRTKKNHTFIHRFTQLFAIINSAEKL